jgi:aminoglycoside 6'-N-acetyltransferase
MHRSARSRARPWYCGPPPPRTCRPSWKSSITRTSRSGGAATTSNGPHGYAIELAGDVVGLIIYREEHDPDHRHAAMDLAVHPDQHGQGLGCDAMRAMATYLFKHRGHHRVVIDPAAHNALAIRSCERAGFKRVGVMRRYERSADGLWHDALLMDLLAEELR